MIRQTSAHKAREKAVIDKLTARWQCEAREFPPLSRLDWYLHRGKLMMCAVEVKCFDRRHDAYGGRVYIDLDKAMAIVLVGMGFAVKSILVCEFQDGLYTAGARNLVGLQTTVIGRRDRKDHDDTSAAVAIPIDRFKCIEVYPT